MHDRWADEAPSNQRGNVTESEGRPRTSGQLNNIWSPASSPTALRHAFCARSHLLVRSLFGQVCRTLWNTGMHSRTLEVCWTGSTANQPQAARAQHRTETCTSDLSGVMGLELAHCTHWRLLHLTWRAGRQAHRRAGALAHWRSGAAVWRFSVPAVLPQCFCHTQSSPEFFLPSSKGNLKLAYTFGVRHRAPNPHSLPPNPHGAHDDRTQGYREDAHAHDGDYPPPASPAVSRQARLD